MEGEKKDRFAKKLKLAIFSARCHFRRRWRKKAAPPNSALTKKTKDANRFGAEAAERRGESSKTAISLSPMKESMTMTMARGASSLEEREEEENKE